MSTTTTLFPRFGTKAQLAKVPALYATESIALNDKIAQIKLFTPDSNWTWWIVELDPETGLAFGLVDGHERELGYFDLNELAEVRGPFGLSIERDKYFDPTPLSQVK